MNLAYKGLAPTWLLGMGIWTHSFRIFLVLKGAEGMLKWCEVTTWKSLDFMKRPIRLDSGMLKKLLQNSTKMFNNCKVEKKFQFQIKHYLPGSSLTMLLIAFTILSESNRTRDNLALKWNINWIFDPWFLLNSRFLNSITLKTNFIVLFNIAVKREHHTKFHDFTSEIQGDRPGRQNWQIFGF